MTDHKKGDESAFWYFKESQLKDGPAIFYQEGLTKRELISAIMMHGFLVTPRPVEHLGELIKGEAARAKAAIIEADALLAELEK